MLKAVAHGLLDLLAPRSCPACDLPLDAGAFGLCGACEPLLEPLARSDSAHAVYVFGGPLADAIRRLKYGRRTDHASALGALLAGACGELAGRVDAVVPIPLHAHRLRERGFNQASLLAAPVARALGVPLHASALRRSRDTRAQAGLDAHERASNVRGCFEAQIPGGLTRVLVIDDVRTTGATFAEAARALRERGAIEVHTLALAGAER